MHWGARFKSVYNTRNWAARALPGKAENRKNVELPIQLLAYQVNCCGAYCCTVVLDVVDWSARIAALLVY